MIGLEPWDIGPLLPSQGSAPIVASQFVVSMPQNVPNGSPVNVLVRAEDAQGDFASSFSGTASVSSSDTAATIPSTVTFNHGFATLQVTFVTAGSQSLTLTDSASSTPIVGHGLDHRRHARRGYAICHRAADGRAQSAHR